ncbi:MAG: peptide chain release factor N(5)-glutamine methyltransferase [Candidatus Gracilibacteria bacterium]|nr:peptide chain release factor N(5)-glutamine methyltransferase [Candidatus Gracilibacteria bacterium]
MKTPNLEEIEFFYNRFYFDKNVLIPRFDTESLVREAIDIIKKNDIKTLIDIGTGSGIIPISIDLNCDLDSVYAIDKSSKALKIASMNKMKLGSKVELIRGDLLNQIIDKDFGEPIMMTANLPYIKADDWENMSEDTRLEPKMALFGGKKTGFELYEKFFRQVLEFKKKNKNKIFLLCEIGFDQKEIAERFLAKNFKDFSFVKDLRGFDRFIRITL